MIRAHKLVVGTEKPFNEICVLCGYNSPGTFSRSFRRFHGVSPSQARARGTSSALQDEGAGEE